MAPPLHHLPLHRRHLNPGSQPHSRPWPAAVATDEAGIAARLAGSSRPPRLGRPPPLKLGLLGPAPFPGLPQAPPLVPPVPLLDSPYPKAPHLSRPLWGASPHHLVPGMLDKGDEVAVSRVGPGAADVSLMWGPVQTAGTVPAAVGVLGPASRMPKACVPENACTPQGMHPLPGL